MIEEKATPIRMWALKTGGNYLLSAAFQTREDAIEYAEKHILNDSWEKTRRKGYLRAVHVTVSEGWDD